MAGAPVEGDRTERLRSPQPNPTRGGPSPTTTSWVRVATAPAPVSRAGGTRADTSRVTPSITTDGLRIAAV